VIAMALAFSTIAHSEPARLIVKLTADATDAGTFAYTLNNISQTKSIVREVLRAPGTVCQ
jgi:hypothetical protein